MAWLRLSRGPRRGVWCRALEGGRERRSSCTGGDLEHHPCTRMGEALGADPAIQDDCPVRDGADQRDDKDGDGKRPDRAGKRCEEREERGDAEREDDDTAEGDDLGDRRDAFDTEEVGRGEHRDSGDPEHRNEDPQSPTHEREPMTAV